VKYQKKCFPIGKHLVAQPLLKRTCEVFRKKKDRFMRLQRVKKQILSLVTILYLASFAHANAEAELYRSALINTLRAAQAVGINKIDGKPIPDLIELSKGIKVAVLPYVEYRNPDGTYRSSGYWDKETNLVVLSRRHFSQMREGVDGITGGGVILHEFSGPLGINDNNHSKSAMLQTILNLIWANGQNTREGKESVIHSMLPIQEMGKRIEMAGGGTSGVGGGGDGRIEIYMTLLYSILFHRLDVGEISKEQFHKACGRIDVLDVQFDFDIEQGKPKYDPLAKKLFVPADATTEENFNKNYDGVKLLVEQLLQ
jgi:hypothetical protein